MADSFQEMTFSEILAQCGDVEEQATDLSGDVVREVRATGRKGSVTIVVSFEERNKTTHELGVTATVRSSPPNRKTMYSFYSNAKGAVGKDPEEHLFTGHDAEREDDPGDPGF